MFKGSGFKSSGLKGYIRVYGFRVWGFALKQVLSGGPPANPDHRGLLRSRVAVGPRALRAELPGPPGAKGGTLNRVCRGLFRGSLGATELGML